MEPGIQLKESGIHSRLESRIKVPLSRNPKCSTWNLETMAWNPETKTVALTTWGDTLIRRKKRTAPLHVALAVHPVIFLQEKTGAREGDTCVSFARAHSLLRPLLPSACYAGYYVTFSPNQSLNSRIHRYTYFLSTTLQS